MLGLEVPLGGTQNGVPRKMTMRLWMASVTLLLSGFCLLMDDL